MTSVGGQDRSTWRNQASEAPTSPLSNRSDDGDHENPLGSNEPRLSKAPAGSETPARPEAPARPTQAPLFTPQNPGANLYSQSDLNRIIQTFVHVSKSRSGDKLKAKTLDIYCNRFHMECYYFCQQCEDHFATARVIGLNRIPFTTFFFRDQINFRW